MMAMIMLAILTTGLVACSSDDDNNGGGNISVTEAELIGTWESVVAESYVIAEGKRYSFIDIEVEEDYRVVYKTDHNYGVSYWNSNTQTWVEGSYDVGTWSLSGNMLTINTGKGTTTGTITEFSASRMVVKDTDTKNGVTYDEYAVFKKVN